MPNLPVTASSRELQRPRPIPRRVRDVITLMVYGRIDDESCAPVDFVERVEGCSIAMPRQVLSLLDLCRAS